MSAQYYRPQRENRGRSRLLYITCLVIIVFLLDLVAGGRLRGALRAGVSSAYGLIDKTGEVVGLTGYFVTHATLARENAQLRQELQVYRSKDAAYASMKRQNEELKAITNFVDRVPGKTAAVISAPSVSPYGTFIINAGSASGVERTDVVFTADGFAAGIVVDLGANNALISEILAPNSSIEATIGDVVVVLQGEGGGNARAQAPRDSDIRVGDIVRAPEVNAPVAVVQKVESAPTEAFKQVYARIPANLETLSVVYVTRK